MAKRKNRKGLLMGINIVIFLCIAVLAVISLTTVTRDKDRGQTQGEVGAGENNKMEDNDGKIDGSGGTGATGDGNVGGNDETVDDAGNKDDAAADGSGIEDDGNAAESDTDGNGGNADENAGTADDSHDSASDSDGLSTEKVEWCFARKDGHEQSGTYEPFDIEQFNAYYLNRNVTDEDKVIYLAFDCGYEYGYTPLILDVLKEHDVKAMFFVTEAFLASSSDVAKRMKEEGHMVGNHTMNHPSLPTKASETVRAEVVGIEDMFKEKTGYELDKFIRPPMGEYSEQVLAQLKDMGYTTIFWSIAYRDYDVDNQPGKEYVLDHFKQYHHNGAITLIHTISESNTQALGEVIEYLREQGYRFGTLDELNAGTNDSL